MSFAKCNKYKKADYKAAAKQPPACLYYAQLENCCGIRVLTGFSSMCHYFDPGNSSIRYSGNWNKTAVRYEINRILSRNINRRYIIVCLTKAHHDLGITDILINDFGFTRLDGGILNNSPDKGTGLHGINIYGLCFNGYAKEDYYGEGD